MFHKCLAQPMVFSFDIPEWWAWDWKSRVTQIIIVELVAPLVALQTWRDYIRGRTMLLFNDSTAVENMLVKGYSNKASDANSLISEFWTMCADSEVCVYIDRVPTDDNPSDGASRGKIHEDAYSCGWEIVRPRLKPRWTREGPGNKDARTREHFVKTCGTKRLKTRSS